MTDPKNGKRSRRSITVGSLRDYPNSSAAKRSPVAMTAMLNANSDNRSVNAPRKTLGEVIAKFELEEMPNRYSTKSAYQSMLRNHIAPRWSGVFLTEIKAMAVEKWLSSLSLSPKSKSNIRGMLNTLFQCARRWEFVESNPIALVRVKGATKRKRKPSIITPTEFCKVLSALDEPHFTMVRIAGTLGLRISEIMGLQWKDFDFDNATLMVQRSVVHGRVDDVKTEYSNDLMPLDETLVSHLRQFRGQAVVEQESPWLFANPATGKPYHQEEIQKNYLRPIGTALGIEKLGWHTFRHSFRSWLDETGASVGVQKDLMRHANISTTMNVYGMSMTEAKREAQSKVAGLLARENRSFRESTESYKFP